MSMTNKSFKVCSSSHARFNYDIHLFAKELGNYPGKLQLIPGTCESVEVNNNV